MGRWEGGARERLQHAALDLFAERGFDGVTVSEIAAAAGLTERTFFRHFSDKREALFGGQEQLAALFLGTIADSTSTDPMALVAEAVAGSAAFFIDDRRSWSRARQAVIQQNVALQERDSLKMTSLAALLGNGLTARGFSATVATLAAECGISAFRVAYSQWISEGELRSFATIQLQVLAELRAVVGNSVS